MNPSPVHYCGADVSKTAIDCHIEKLAFQVPNTTEGHARVLAQLAPWGGHAQVICEGTGGLERPLCAALAHARVPVSVLNPRWVRDFARSQGLLEKTDSIDAGVLALYGERLRPEPSAPVTPTQQKLAALHARARTSRAGSRGGKDPPPANHRALGRGADRARAGLLYSRDR